MDQNTWNGPAHEVAGGLCICADGSLRLHVLKPLAREANVAGTLCDGSGEGIGLDRRSMRGKENKSPQ